MFSFQSFFYLYLCSCWLAFTRLVKKLDFKFLPQKVKNHRKHWRRRVVSHKSSNLNFMLLEQPFQNSNFSNSFRLIIFSILSIWIFSFVFFFFPIHTEIANVYAAVPNFELNFIYCGTDCHCCFDCSCNCCFHRYKIGGCRHCHPHYIFSNPCTVPWYEYLILHFILFRSIAFLIFLTFRFLLFTALNWHFTAIIYSLYQQMDQANQQDYTGVVYYGRP